MNILVTGSDGYIGTQLTQILIGKGYKVGGIDTGFFNGKLLYNDIKKTQKTISKDIRDITVKDLTGFDAVVHLAELSNDPLGKINPNITYEINYHGSVNLAKKAKEAKVPRFIYSSSCSVYGISKKWLVDEDSKLNPQTEYAKCKVLVEKAVSKLADKNFSPTFLRNATVFGASPAMRFDIVLNNLAGLAWTEKEIVMHSDGTPWRPLIHILDVCDAIVCVLKAPRKLVHNQILNVGDDNQNYQVKDIAQIISGVFPNSKITFGNLEPDNRSYKVSFKKINKVFPDFKCQRDAKNGTKELLELFKKINLDKVTFYSKNFTRLKQIEYLIKTKQIDNKFYWKEE